MNRIRSVISGIFQGESWSLPALPQVDNLDYDSIMDERSPISLHSILEKHRDEARHCYRLTKLESVKSPWVVKEFWIYSLERIIQMKEILKIIVDARLQLEREAPPIPWKPIDNSIINIIKTILENYCRLLTVVRQFEVHWQTALESSPDYLDKGQNLDHYNFYFELINEAEKKSKVSDLGKFKSTDYYIDRSVYNILEWCLDHEIYGKWRKAAEVEYRKSRQGYRVVSTLLHSDQDGNSSQYETEFSDDEFMRDTNKQVFQLSEGVSLGFIPMTESKYRELPKKSCPYNCVCYHCYILNKERLEESSCSSSEERDALHPGLTELNKKHQRRKKVKPTDESTKENDSDDGERPIVRRETQFQTQLIDWEHQIGSIDIDAETVMFGLWKSAANSFYGMFGWIGIIWNHTFWGNEPVFPEIAANEETAENSPEENTLAVIQPEHNHVVIDLRDEETCLD